MKLLLDEDLAYFLPLPPFLPFALRFFLLAFLCFGQPVTAIFVLWLIIAPFCATNSVGIASFAVQRLPFAASAEYGPSRERQFEAAEGHVGDRLERAAA